MVYIKYSLIRVLMISFLYALIEVYYTPSGEGGVFSLYHFIVFLIGFFAGLSKSLRVTVANALVFSVTEDMFYWVFERRLPVQWSPWYVIVWHIPVYYIPFLIIAVYLYKKSR